MKDKPEKGTAEELVALFPGARQLKVLAPLDAADPSANRPMVVVVVRPLNALEAAQLLVKLKPLFEAYDPAGAVVTLVAEQMPMVIDLAASCTDRDGEWLCRLDAGDCLDVLVAVVEANENFLRRVADLVAGPTGKRLAAMFQQVGGTTPSPSSPSTEASPPRKPLSSLQGRSTRSFQPSIGK